ncbi:MAG: hypothetical protein ABSH06_27115 [Thermodesulfobacteriota bacterium]
MRYEAAQEMRVGHSESTCRTGFQDVIFMVDARVIKHHADAKEEG